MCTVGHVDKYIITFKFHFMSLQYDKHIFIITNTMHTIGVDKIKLFKTT